MLSRITCLVGSILQSLLILLLPMIGPILRPDDHYLLRYYVAIFRVVQPVMHRVFALLRPNNGKTNTELLFDLKGYSNARYKSDFKDKDQRIKLNNNEPSECFDITLLYKLLQRICGLPDSNNACWMDPGSLENSLKRLKDHRNVLSHENISFTSEEFERNIQDLEELCRKALIAAGLRRRTLITSDIADMEKGMEEVLLGEIDLWEPYKEALNKMRMEQTSVLLREGMKDIRELGKNLRILNPFAWLFDSKYSHLDVEQIFTELDIEGTNKIETKDILTTTLPTNKLPDSIVISGSPGIGKTSLFRFLVQDWLSKNPTVLAMENIDLLIPVELRHVRSSDVKDLLKFEVLRSVCRHLKIDDVNSSLDNISLLWLLDGYDEASWKTKEVVKEMLKKFPNSRVIVTTRSEFTQEIKECLDEVHRCYMSIDLKGFSEANIEHCAKKLINVSVLDCSERSKILKDFLKFAKEKNLFKWDVFSVPLFVTIIILLWLDNPDKLPDIKTISGLYSLLVDHIIHKLLVRNSYKELNQKRFKTEKNLNSFLDKMGQMLFKKDYEFSLKEYEIEYLVDLCSKLGLPFTDTMSAFFVCAERPTPTGFREDYTVIHRSVTEFLIARAFCNQMINKGWDVMNTAEYWFISAREVLLKHDPQSSQLEGRFDFENLTKDLPDDVYQRFRDKRLIMSSDDFFCTEDFCHVCIKLQKDKGATYFWKPHGKFCRVLTSKNFWCHLRDHVGGMKSLYIVGYLSIKQELNERRCEQLAFFYFTFTGFGHGDFQGWNLVVKEANNELFNERFFKYLSSFTWVFYTDYNVEAAKELLALVTPKTIFLHYCFEKYKSEGIEHTREAGKILISSIRTFMVYSLELHLDLSYFLLNSDEGVSFTKTCLELVLEEGSHYQLITVRCPANVDILNLLRKAIHLRELIVRIDGKDLPKLAELVSELPDVGSLSVVVDPSSFSGVDLPILIPEDKKIFMDFIVIINAFNVDPREVALGIKRLCSDPCTVILHGNLQDLDLNNYLTCTDSVVSSMHQMNRLEICVNYFGAIVCNKASKLKSLELIMKNHYSKSAIPVHFRDIVKGCFIDDKSL